MRDERKSGREARRAVPDGHTYRVRIWRTLCRV